MAWVTPLARTIDAARVAGICHTVVACMMLRSLRKMIQAIAGGAIVLVKSEKFFFAKTYGIFHHTIRCCVINKGGNRKRRCKSRCPHASLNTSDVVVSGFRVFDEEYAGTSKEKAVCHVSFIIIAIYLLSASSSGSSGSLQTHHLLVNTQRRRQYQPCRFSSRP